MPPKNPGAKFAPARIRKGWNFSWFLPPRVKGSLIDCCPFLIDFCALFRDSNPEHDGGAVVLASLRHACPIRLSRRVQGWFSKYIKFLQLNVTVFLMKAKWYRWSPSGPWQIRRFLFQLGNRISLLQNPGPDYLDRRYFFVAINRCWTTWHKPVLQ